MTDFTLTQYILGTCTPEKRAEVEAWLVQNPQNRKILEELYLTLKIDSVYRSMDHARTENSLKSLKKKIAHSSRQTRVRLPRTWLNLAAAFGAGAIITLSGIWLSLSKLQTANVLTIQTPEGQRAYATLPDGSNVWLNGNSSLVYTQSWWKKQRLVRLEGEAYFEVNKKQGTSFEVNTKEITTRVLGTKFNVRSRAGERKVVTTLLEGSVKVIVPSHSDTNQEFTLRPGQTIDIDLQSQNHAVAFSTHEHPSEVLLWTEEQLKFSEETLQDIARKLEILFDIHVKFSDSHLKTERFTGVFSTRSSPDAILNILQHTKHFTYTKQGNTFILSR